MRSADELVNQLSLEKLNRNRLIFVILFFTVLMLVPQILTLDVSLDEMASFFYIRTNRFFLNTENTPPLYYMAAKLWSLIFGDSTMALRGFNLVLALLYPLVGYKIGEKFFGKKQAIITAILFATSAIHLRYALEIRSYIMFELFCALNFYYFMESEKVGHLKWKYWLSLALMLLSHYMGFVVLTAQAIILLTHKKRIQNRVWIYLLLLISILSLTKALYGISLQHLDAASAGWLFNWQNILQNGINYLNFVLILSFLFFIRDTRYGILDQQVAYSLLTLSGASLLLQKIPLVERYFIFAIPLLLVRIGDTAVTKGQRLGRLVLIGYLALNFFRLFAQYDRPHSGWPEVAQALKSQSILAFSENAQFVNLEFKESGIEVFDLNDLSRKSPDMGEYYIITKKINADPNTQPFLRSESFDLVQQKDFGVLSYEPLTISHFKRKNEP